MANKVPNTDRRYLGDSVYAELIDSQGWLKIKLCLWNGEDDHNLIFLEPEVAFALVDYIQEKLK